MTSSEAALDLSRRRVATISFLSNISTDDSVTEIRLDCLQNTHVLRDFNQKKRQRLRNQTQLRREASIFHKNPNVPRRPIMEKLPRKLTFVQSTDNPDLITSNSTFYCENVEDNTHLRPKGLLDEPPTPNPELDTEGETDNLMPFGDGRDNLLHLDLSKMMEERLAQNPWPKSAPIQAAPSQDINPNNRNESFLFTSQEKVTSISNEQLAVENTKNLVNIKRRTNQTQTKVDEFRNNYGSSNESLVPSSLGARLRKISGNISENSSCSLREIRYFKADEDKNIQDERVLFVSNDHKVPFAIFSVIPFHKSSRHQRSDRRQSHSRLSFREKDSKRIRTNSGNRPLSSINDAADPLDIISGDSKLDENQETSYSHLLEPTEHEKKQGSSSNSLAAKKSNLSRCTSIDVKNSSLNLRQEEKSSCFGYSPHELEGWLVAGRHRTFLPFSSYVTSVIEYVKPSEMKKELNSKFKERFPNLQLSLSKLRSLKKEMKYIVLHECNLDMLTVALAYVYFERLVLKGTINKINRKYCAGACLILAAKLNDVKGTPMSNLIEKTENVFRLHRKDLLSSEFAVLVALEFALHVPSWHVFPHYQRLLYEN